MTKNGSILDSDKVEIRRDGAACPRFDHNVDLRLPIAIFVSECLADDAKNTRAILNASRPDRDRQSAPSLPKIAGARECQFVTNPILRVRHP